MPDVRIGAASGEDAVLGNAIAYKIKGHEYVSVFSGRGGWIGLPAVAGLDLDDKFGAIGSTALTKVIGLNKIPQGGTLYTFHVPDKEAANH
jgi:hypothetical protein